MRMGTITMTLVAALVFTGAACNNSDRGVQTSDRQENAADARTLVRNAAAVAQQMKADPKLHQMMQQAKGVFIIPDWGKGALVVDGSGGGGVVLAHEGGRWSAPAFYDVGKISIGAQAGGKAGKMALLLMTDKALASFKQGNSFSLTADSGFTVADYSAHAQGEAGTPDAVVWSDTQGAFAGVALGVRDIVPDEGQNRAYYDRTVSATDIFTGKVPGPQDRPIRSVLAG